MLFAALVLSINLTDVCFIELDEHLFAGVEVPKEQDDHCIRFDDKTWVLIELTDSWPIGRIPLEHLTSIMNGHYKVAELH